MSYCFGLRSSNWSQSGAFHATPVIFADDRRKLMGRQNITIEIQKAKASVSTVLIGSARTGTGDSGSR